MAAPPCVCHSDTADVPRRHPMMPERMDTHLRERARERVRDR